MDDDTRAAEELTVQLRRWVTLTRKRDPADQRIAAALAYELCALVAVTAPSMEDAYAFLEQVHETQIKQLHQFGLGIHP